METSRAKMMELLRAKYPNMFLRTTEEFDGGKNGIWSSGEDGIKAKDGFTLFNYYAEDYREVRYVFGVHKEIGNLLEKNGWYTEWHDCGTIMFYPI